MSNCIVITRTNGVEFEEPNLGFRGKVIRNSTPVRLTNTDAVEIGFAISSSDIIKLDKRVITSQYSVDDTSLERPVKLKNSRNRLFYIEVTISSNTSVNKWRVHLSNDVFSLMEDQTYRDYIKQNSLDELYSLLATDYQLTKEQTIETVHTLARKITANTEPQRNYSAKERALSYIFLDNTTKALEELSIEKQQLQNALLSTNSRKKINQIMRSLEKNNEWESTLMNRSTDVQ